MKAVLTMVGLALTAMAFAATPASAAFNPDNLPHADTDPSHWSELDMDYLSPLATTGNSTDLTRTNRIVSLPGQQTLVQSTKACDWISFEYEILLETYNEYSITGQDGANGEEECFWAVGNGDMSICAYSPSGFQEEGDLEFWLREGEYYLAPFGRLVGDTAAGGIAAESVVFDHTSKTLPLYNHPVYGNHYQSLEQSGTIEFEDTLVFSGANSASCQFPELQS